MLPPWPLVLWLSPSFAQGSKPRYVPQRLHVWGALDLTLQLLNPSVFAATLERVPSLVPIILTNACVPPARGDASGNLHWRSLSCLGHLLERMGPRVWEITSYDPSVVVDDLIGQAFRAREERFHKSIIGKLSMVLKTLEEREDGEGLDAMRRRVLYFLLMQVTPPLPSVSLSSRGKR